MNQTSVAATGTAGTATAAVATLIAIFAKHFNLDIAPTEQLTLAIGAVTAAHWLAQQLAAYVAKKAPVAASSATA